MASHAFHVSPLVYIPQVLVFGLGITISHAAFCVYNDICDCNLDGKVGMQGNKRYSQNINLIS